MTQNLAQRIYQAAHLSGEFTLRFGPVSHEYFGKSLFESEPKLLSDIAAAKLFCHIRISSIPVQM